MQDELRDWLMDELQKRNWSIRELASRAGIPHSSISRLNSYNERIGFKTCVAIAGALNVPPISVLERAGLLQRVPQDTQETRLLKHIYQDLDEAGRRQLVEYAEVLRDK